MADGQEVAPTAEMVQYFKDNPPIRIDVAQAEDRLKPYLAHVELQTKQGYKVPLIVDVDPDLDPRVAVDLAIAELMYQEFIHEMTYSWEEMRPRIIRRFNHKYGIAS